MPAPFPWRKTRSLSTSAFGTGCRSSSPASPIIADIDNDGDLDIVLASNGELVAWEAVGGAQLTRVSLSSGGSGCQTQPSGALVFAAAWSVAGSAAIGDIDNDGLLEIVTAGYQSFPNVSPGALYAWNLSTAAAGSAPWPMFKRNARGQSLYRWGLFLDGFESNGLGEWSAAFP